MSHQYWDRIASDSLGQLRLYPTEESLYKSIASKSPTYKHHYLYHHPRLLHQQNLTNEEKIDDFKVVVDVQHFEPEDLSVKVKDRTLIVEAKHQEKPDEHGFVYRHFIRKYKIPEGHNIPNIISHLSSDGVLTVRAPKINKNGETHVPIIYTGPVSFEDKSHAK